jgi:acyl dehydratase
VLYLEDFTLGAVFVLGATTVTEEAIIRFGREFDPQPFHVDPAEAERSAFGGLVASGWHVSSMFMRLLVDGLLHETAGLGGLGVDDMHFVVPVRPGDTLAGRAVVGEARPSKSKPDRGVLGLRMELVNQRGETAWYCTSWSLVQRRSVV